MSTPPRDGIGGPPPGHHGDHGTGHEEDVLLWRPVVLGVTIVVILLGGSIVARNLLEDELFAREDRSSAPASPLADRYGRILPPPPRLQVNPERDLAELRRSAREVLDSYGWVDERAGIVRIPIARAIDILAAQASSGQADAGTPSDAAGGRPAEGPAAPRTLPQPGGPASVDAANPAQAPAHGGAR